MDIEKSTSIRNYALTALCLAAIVGVLSFAALNYTEIQQENYYHDRESGLHAYARCELSKYVTINIETNDSDLKNVSCTSLNPGLFEPEKIVLGDMSKGSNDVCSFKALEDITEPARFEIKYNNGQVMKKACDTGWTLLE